MKFKTIYFENVIFTPSFKMNKFKEILDVLDSDIDRFEAMFHEFINSGHEILEKIVEYIFETKGKRIRPILVYLTARLFSSPTKTTDIAALVVETIHTATLLHDDVIDEAILRRSKPTINHKWDDKTAILSGDYLFAKAMNLTTENGEYRIFDIISPTIVNLSVGELLQMKYANQFSVDEDKYYEIINYKTTSLLSACCEVGAYSAGASKDEINYCRQFGEKLGCIFQIKDDILDYIGNKKTGKKIGVDIKERKVTLPLICAWKNMSLSERSHLAELWSSAEKTPEIVSQIQSLVIDKGGISGCEHVMKLHKDEASAILKNFKESDSKKALQKLLNYMLERDN
ncbi:polyprenyl synthetase family protein [Bacteroidales bacterium OttesenSCG-928-I21]|nr:polyprenyl synthetase family protein [Bacteroidales bacterium OttesenSCG-928-I21]